jgi:hypothetical protein
MIRDWGVHVMGVGIVLILLLICLLPLVPILSGPPSGSLGVCPGEVVVVRLTGERVTVLWENHHSVGWRVCCRVASATEVNRDGILSKDTHTVRYAEVLFCPFELERVSVAPSSAEKEGI